LVERELELLGLAAGLHRALYESRQQVGWNDSEALQRNVEQLGREHLDAAIAKLGNAK